MFQITPILGDNLSVVISNVVPIIAQNLASKNSEIQDMASEILNLFVEYLGNFEGINKNLKYMLVKIV